MASKADFDKRANDAWTTRQDGLKAIDADRNLSPEGKQRAAERVQAAYEAATRQVQDDALAWAKSQRGVARLALRFEDSREAKKLRAAVGDVLAADIIRRQLEAMGSAGIQARYESSEGDDWLRAIVGGYGRLIVEARGGERPTAADVAALTAMKPKRDAGDVQYEQQLAELDSPRFDHWAEDLDRGARAQRYSDKYRVSAAHVPLPVPGDPLT